MATNFPTSVDAFVNPVSNDSLNTPSHSAQHANANDAIEAIESFVLGTTGNLWTTYTPTVSAASGTITTSVVNWARYSKIGNTVTLNFAISITNNGTGSGSLIVTLPSNAQSIGGNYGIGSGRENAATGNMLMIQMNSSSAIRILTYNNLYPAGTNYVILGTITYEAA